MAQKYCKNCNLDLDKQVKFCPKCGGAVSIKKKNVSDLLSSTSFRRNLFIVAGIVALLVVILIVVFSLAKTSFLKNSAIDSKDDVHVKVDSNFIDKNIGNLGCNICSQANTVCDQENFYYAGTNGIYKSSAIDSTIINKDNSKKIADGHYSCLNYFDQNIFCINVDDNCIYKLSDLDSEDNLPYLDKIYTSENGFAPNCIAINSDNLYVLSKNSSSYSLISFNLRSKNKVNDVFKCEGTNAWMFLDEGTLRLCVSSSGSWTAYKGSIDGNKTSGIEKYCSGSGDPISVAFYEDKIYSVYQSSSNGSSISSTDASGNRNDISLTCATQKLLLIQGTGFLQSGNADFKWFNTDTNMSHDIQNDSFKNQTVKTINLNKDKFCVLYTDDTMVCTNINQLT